MQFQISYPLRKKATQQRQVRNHRSDLVSNEGLFIVTSPPPDTTFRMDMIMSDSNKPGPSNQSDHSYKYAHLRRIGKPKSVLQSPSEASFESALSRIDPLPERPANTPSSLLLGMVRQDDLRKSSSAPATKSNVTLLAPLPSRSQDNLTGKSKGHLRSGLRGPLCSVTPGYIREIPRSLPLKRQLTKTPSYQVPSTADSLYLSWKEYFQTPDPFTSYHSAQLFDSIKMDVPDSIKHFLEEIDYKSPGQSGARLSEPDGRSGPNTPKSEQWNVNPPKSLSPPKAIESVREPEALLEINVSGECFIVRRSLVRRYPNSLLGSPDIEKYFVESLNCYFFNRSRLLFEFVLQLYQCGFINLPPNFLALPHNKAALNRELDFFRLRSELKTKSASKMSSASSEGSIDARKRDADELMKLVMSEPGWTQFKKIKLKLYVFLTNPQSSKLSLVWMIFDMVLVLLSISSLVVESETRYEKYFVHNDNFLFRIFLGIEIISQTFFTLDFTLRLVSWPRITSFFRDGMNVCDFVSLLPYYIPQLIQLVDDRNVKSLIVFRIIRMFRIARVFRVIRHSHGLLIIFQFLFNSGKELVMLAGLFGILTLLFSSMIFFVEPHDDAGTFKSISASAWWAVVTLTGIGYGDVVPKSATGQCVAVLAIMTGVVFLALPMTIIITKFTKHMERHYQQ
ncbi:hypothetical protein ACHWQZ_G008614 [Mnemiopsis leidyi]